jgi:hypothetical protein
VHIQVSGIAIVCGLLFLEEAGLPLPVAPGEAVLIGAGLLIAGGGAPVWLIVPLAYLAVICGVLTGYTWAHLIGPKPVHAFAARLHAGGPYDRAAARLKGATPFQIAASRLLPGLRVYTFCLSERPFAWLLLTLLRQVDDDQSMPDFDAIVLKQVANEVRNIKAEYRGVASEESIDLVADQSLQNLANSKVPQFVALFVGRFTRERLRELTGFRPRAQLNLMTR